MPAQECLRWMRTARVHDATIESLADEAPQAVGTPAQPRAAKARGAAVGQTFQAARRLQQDRGCVRCRRWARCLHRRHGAPMRTAEAVAPVQRSSWTGCANSVPSVCSRREHETWVRPIGNLRPTVTNRPRPVVHLCPKQTHATAQADSSKLPTAGFRSSRCGNGSAGPPAARGFPFPQQSCRLTLASRRTPSLLRPSGWRRRGRSTRRQARGHCACIATGSRGLRSHRRSPVRPTSRRGPRS